MRAPPPPPSHSMTVTPSTRRVPYAGERRLEVRVVPSAGGAGEVVLEDLSWGSGVGWFVQKSIRLDRAQVDALLGALCCARRPDCARNVAHGQSDAIAASERDTASRSSDGALSRGAPRPRGARIVAIDTLRRRG